MHNLFPLLSTTTRNLEDISIKTNGVKLQTHYEGGIWVSTTEIRQTRALKNTFSAQPARCLCFSSPARFSSVKLAKKFHGMEVFFPLFPFHATPPPTHKGLCDKFINSPIIPLPIRSDKGRSSLLT